MKYINISNRRKRLIAAAFKVTIECTHSKRSIRKNLLKSNAYMKIYEIFHPGLKVSVQYRLLTLEETEILVNEYDDLEQEQFMRIVLETVIYNLKQDVTEVLRMLPKDKANRMLLTLYNGALMLNPGLDADGWMQITESPLRMPNTMINPKRGTTTPALTATTKIKHLTKQKFMNLEQHLRNRIIGQNEAITELVKALKRSQVGLGDENRPVGVFIFGGASGVGKTLLAKELHSYLYEGSEIIRIDCGEYQHKHENVKLLGAPQGYIGYEDGGILTDKLVRNPQTIVLLDEIEKAHPDLFNTFLRVLDEGIMTDSKGTQLDFRNTIIIMTTNLGNEEMVSSMRDASVGFARKSNDIPKREIVVKSTERAIHKHFKPEFVNRIDKLITFNNLAHDDYIKIAGLELENVQTKLTKRGCTLSFDTDALEAMVRDGVSHVQGARGLAQLRRDRIEDPLADLILNGRYPRGTVFQLTHDATDYKVLAKRPASKRLPKLELVGSL